MRYTLLFALLFAIGCTSQPAQNDESITEEVQDPLPSWNDSNSREEIMAFVEAVTDPASPDFVEPEDRIATYDNDGTLWAEQPAYFQLYFGMDMVSYLMPQHPEWANDPVMQAAANRDVAGAMAGGMESLAKIIFVSHGNMTTDEFQNYATNWLDSARHPQTDKKFTEMIYKPMLEVLRYMEDNGFKNFIVSGGGIEFLRMFAPEVYGIPTERIVGSSLELEFEAEGTDARIMRMPALNFVDDKEGKPVGIHYHIGKKPIASFGNSDGDLQMLLWADSGEGKRLAAYVHHTDDEREYAYDRGSHIGGLDAGLDSAASRGWTVIDMKADWKEIYP